MLRIEYCRHVFGSIFHMKVTAALKKSPHPCISHFFICTIPPIIYVSNVTGCLEYCLTNQTHAFHSLPQAAAHISEQANMTSMTNVTSKLMRSLQLY